MLTLCPHRLTLANCFSGSPLKVRLLEKRPTRARAGRADGLKYLTLEIFDALGVHDHVMSEACRHEEICHWSSREDGKLQRLTIVPDIVPGLDEPREVTLAQGWFLLPPFEDLLTVLICKDKVERYLEENLDRRSSVKVERGKIPIALTIDERRVEDPCSYPISLSVVDATTSSINGCTENAEDQEIIQAKYVIGCDGANSWTRKQMNIGVHLEGSDSVWGSLVNVPIYHVLILMKSQESSTSCQRRTFRTFGKRVQSVHLHPEACSWSHEKDALFVSMYIWKMRLPTKASNLTGQHIRQRR